MKLLQKQTKWGLCAYDKQISPSSFVSSSLSSTSSSSWLSSPASSPSSSSSAFSSNKQCYCKSQRSRQDWELGKEKRILMQKTKHEDWALKYCLQVRKENLSIVAVVLVLAIWELIVVSCSLRGLRTQSWKHQNLMMFAYWVLPGQTILGWTSTIINKPCCWAKEWRNETSRLGRIASLSGWHDSTTRSRKKIDIFRFKKSVGFQLHC